MKQARIISAGGCLAALLLAGCAGVSPNSTASPLGRAAQGAIGLPGITGPLYRCDKFKLRVFPWRQVIKVNQQLTLSDWAWVPEGYGVCEKIDEPASWESSRGGRIRPIYGGLQAIFHAVRPGVYRVRAKWYSLHARDTVTVTSS